MEAIRERRHARLDLEATVLAAAELGGDEMSHRSAFGLETTTDEVLEGIDLSGRRALVTGASGDVGAATARALAPAGAAVTIAARVRSNGEAIAERIRSAHDVDVRYACSSWPSRRACAGSPRSSSPTTPSCTYW